MFIELEDLARQTTLLITISKEGSDQLRVGITPAPTDSKQTPTLKAISLVGTAAELDEGLADALVLWQAPKRSLAEQVRAAADDDAEPVATAKAPTAPAKVKGKPGPKAKNTVTTASGDAAGGGDAAAAGTPEPVLADDAAGGDDAAAAGAPEPVLAGYDSAASHKGGSQNHPTSGQAQDGDDPTVDTFTLELF